MPLETNNLDLTESEFNQMWTGYDTMNRRIVKHLDTDSDGDVDSSDDKIGFYWCAQHLVEERGGAGSGNVIVNYVNSHNYVDEVILMTTSTSNLVDAKYYLCDLRYSVYGFVDQSGQVVERYQYDPYGKRTVMDASYSVQSSASVEQRFGYTGREHDDESGLMNFRNRYWSVDLGRFVSRDPFMGDAEFATCVKWGINYGCVDEYMEAGVNYHDGMSLYRGYFVPIGLDYGGTWSFAPWVMQAVWEANATCNAMTLLAQASHTAMTDVYNPNVTTVSTDPNSVPVNVDGWIVFHPVTGLPVSSSNIPVTEITGIVPYTPVTEIVGVVPLD